MICLKSKWQTLSGVILFTKYFPVPVGSRSRCSVSSPAVSAWWLPNSPSLWSVPAHSPLQTQYFVRSLQEKQLPPLPQLFPLLSVVNFTQLCLCEVNDIFYSFKFPTYYIWILPFSYFIENFGGNKENDLNSQSQTLDSFRF